MSSIYQKILTVQKSLGRISKNGRNEFHKYDYVTEADILEQVLEKVNEAGLICFASTESSVCGIHENGSRFADVLLRLTIADPESGETVEALAPGYAEDKGDKAVYKALTGANKYAYLKFFGISTGDDPENETEKTTKTAPVKSISRKANTLPFTQEQNEELKGFTVVLTPQEIKAITGLDTFNGLNRDDFQAGLDALHQYWEEKRLSEKEAV